jgi:hypothetical protein
MEQLGSHGKDYINFDISVFLKKSIEKIQASLNSDKNNGTLHEDRYTFTTYHSILP